MIQELVQKIPVELLTQSGKVFYSGRIAFSGPIPLYVLGLNPGGNSSDHKSETIGSHTKAVIHQYPENWSAYRDESWKGKSAGTHGMAPRVLYLFEQLGLNPGEIPCSNLIFLRSPREIDLKGQFDILADLCWPFHAAVIAYLHPRTVLCLGRRVGRYVCRRVKAGRLLSEVTEENRRKWSTRAFTNGQGFYVIVATHPSIANWCTPETDPTLFIRDVLNSKRV